MKTMNSIDTDSFYNSATTMTGTWYHQPHPNVRQKLYQTQPASLEQHKAKQEVICAVILALCLLFAFIECLAGFAAS